MKKYLLPVICIIFILLVLIFDSFASYSEKTIYAMDTVMNIKIKGNSKHLETIENILYDIDGKFNAYNENSYIYKLNNGKTEEVPDDVAVLINKSLELCELTKGNFNITLKEIKDLWNVDGTEHNVPEDKDINVLLKKADYKKIVINGNKVNLNGNKIDLGGIVKGYATDLIVDYLKSNNIKEAIIDLGGNVYAYGNDKMKIGIQKPFAQRGDVLCSCIVSNKAVISSGIYERYFEKEGKMYHHIFDPVTGKPVDNGILSVTVISENSAYADALSTAILVMGEEKAVDFYNINKDFEFCIFKDDKLICSPGFPADDNDKTIKVEVIG